MVMEKRANAFGEEGEAGKKLWETEAEVVV